MKSHKMKKLINPTTHFFSEAEKNVGEMSPEIEKFVKQLIDKKTCQLCKKDYDSNVRIPRILIHCGHTFCTPCLEKFYTNRRVRCPMCLKLVKYFDSIERLPINHTIFVDVVKKQNQATLKEGKNIIIKDPSKFLFSEFQRVQKEAHRQENPQRIDRDSGLPFCVFHAERVEHFFCKAHNSSGCRVCIEIGHSNADCEVIDLYNEDDPFQYQNIMDARIEERQEPDISDPYLPVGQQKQLGFFLGENGKSNEVYMKNFLEDDDSDGDVEQI